MQRSATRLPAYTFEEKTLFLGNVWWVVLVNRCVAVGIRLTI